MKIQLILIGLIFVSAVQASETSRVELYGSFRPVLNVTTQDDVSTVDVADALSRFGLQGDTQLKNNLGQAFFKGEWSVPINDSAQLEKSRLAYVGIENQYGTLSIGKLRPVHYTMIAEPVDIFNHAASPYAYDNSGSPFFIDNTVKYSLSWSAINFSVASRNSGSNQEDLFNAGLSYQLDLRDIHFYLALANLQQGFDTSNLNDSDTANHDSNAMAMSITIAKLYIASAYQQISQKSKIGVDSDSSTIDLSLAYALSSDWKVKAGWFNLDDDLAKAQSSDHKGYNLTLESQLAENVRVHAEYLAKDFANQDEVISAFNLGFRYDFASEL